MLTKADVHRGKKVQSKAAQKAKKKDTEKKKKAMDQSVEAVVDSDSE